MLSGIKPCSPAKLSLDVLFTAGKLNPDIEFGGGVLLLPYCVPEKLLFCVWFTDGPEFGVPGVVIVGAGVGDSAGIGVSTGIEGFRGAFVVADAKSPKSSSPSPPSLSLSIRSSKSGGGVGAEKPPNVDPFVLPR